MKLQDTANTSLIRYYLVEYGSQNILETYIIG